MSVQPPPREPFAEPPGAQTRPRAGTTLHAQEVAPAGIRRARANCGFCGEAWFGDVTYCPYCGRPSASASVPTATETPPEADSDWFEETPHALVGDVRSAAGTPRAGTMRRSSAPAGAGGEQPGMDWKPWAKPIALATVLAAFVLAAFVFAVDELAGTASDSPGPPGAVRAPGGDAARSGTLETSAGVAASAPAVPRADTEPPAQQQAPAPPAQQQAPEPPAQQQAPAPTARNRSLCSAANEAAGLCTPE
jgi:hypothetical protein